MIRAWKGDESDGAYKIHIKPNGWTPHRVSGVSTYVDKYSIADFADRRKYPENNSCT